MIKKQFFLMAIVLLLGACASGEYHDIEPASGDRSYVRPSQRTYTYQNASIDRRASASSQSSSSASGLMDPMQAHLMARKQVNPRDTRSRRSYTKKTTPYNQRTAGHAKATNNTQASKIATRNIITNAPKPDHKPGVKVASLGGGIPASAYIIPPRKPRAHSQSGAGSGSLGTVVKPILTKPTLAARPVSTNAQSLATIRDIRVGAHTGKTRIVFDVDRAPSFHKSINGNHKSITARFSGAYWGTQIAKSYPNDPYLSSYRADNQNGDSHVTLSFKRPVTIAASTIYPPQSGNSSYRVIMDIVPR